MFRRSGMKIFDKGHFQTPLRFAGVFTAEGSKLDALLRTLEPPSHSAWEPERGEDPKLSRAVLHDLYAWINERVRELVGAVDVTEVDAEGISQYLPDEIEDDTTGSPLQNEANEQPAVVLDMRIRSATPSTVSTHEPDNAGGDEGEGDGGVDTNGEGHRGNGGGGGEGGKGINKSHQRVELTNVRIYCTDPSSGRYRVLFEPQSGDTSFIRLFVIGEVGTEPAAITKFSVNGGPEVSGVKEKGTIGPLALPQGKRAVVEVVLEDSLRCALGVSAHAN
jgi:hypothetical protein